MAKHLDRTYLRAFKPSVKSVNYEKKVRKVVFIKWLAAKVRLRFFKNNSAATVHKIYSQVI